MLFGTGEALIVHGIGEARSLPAPANLSFLGVFFLGESDALLLSDHFGAGVTVAPVLWANNFDPPEDRPSEPEFTWAPMLINDFSDVNDDVGTVRGVRCGHFTTLVSWQPRVDRNRTKLVAIVAPGEGSRTRVTEPESLAMLSTALAEAGYNAIGIRCNAGDEPEFEDATRYATAITARSGLPVFHVSRGARNIESTPFVATAKDLLSPRVIQAALRLAQRVTSGPSTSSG